MIPWCEGVIWVVEGEKGNLVPRVGVFPHCACAKGEYVLQDMGEIFVCQSGCTFNISLDVRSIYPSVIKKGIGRRKFSLAFFSTGHYRLRGNDRGGGERNAEEINI